VPRQVLVNHTDELTRVAFLEESLLREVQLEAALEKRIVGNIYKGKVVRVLPGMNACFVDIGIERTGFLYALDIGGDGQLDEGQESILAATDKSERSTDVRIETLVREHQEILVQVAKEPLGNKGARLTGHITLPGILSVLLPNVRHVGVSRRIENPEERQRLKSLGEALRPADAGVILRTVAEDRTQEEIATDIDFLAKLWQEIREGSDAVSAPTLVHEDMPLLLRAARDLICHAHDELWVDSEPGFRQVRNFVQRFQPAAVSKINRWTEDDPLFDRYGVDVEIARALQRRVWLKSGGHIVIDRTEALTVVDVNSGKNVGKGDPEETIFAINIEAAKEIAYQLRLRNIGGIIVIDFIDMLDSQHRQQVRSELVQSLERDHARTRVLPMSELGLVELTRKRVTESLLTKLTEPCFYCEGKGYLQNPGMVAQRLMAKIRKEIRRVRGRALQVHANPKVVSALLEIFEAAIEGLEKAHKKDVVLTERASFHLEQYEVFADQ
jgi:ribonuclease G